MNADDPRKPRSFFLTLLQRALLVGLAAPVLLWATAALRFAPAPEPTGIVLALLYGLANGTALIFLRPWRRSVGMCAVLFGLVVLGFFLVPPSNDREWIEDVAVTPRAIFEGDRVTIQGVRNFDYRSEFEWDANWEERHYDLSKLESLDLSLTDWGAPGIVHTMLSFGFSDGQVLCISIETRKEVGESYSAIRGFFRSYELYYVLADERDLIRLRTNHRTGEEVSLYRLAVEPEGIRALLVDYLETVNAIADEPRWYNALTGNCTTGIHVHARSAGSASPWDWRILVNGQLPELLRERDMLASDLPLGELKPAVVINDAARAADQDPAFSARIREGVPGM